mmetsp:Transcript_66551/g.195242  ORF Transcript_66551/g.195242 Transcript_66551/m.195242 type:complete len:244 (-) Transcript_66551:16-747(-)
MSTILSMVMPSARFASPLPDGCRSICALIMTSSSSEYCRRTFWKAFSDRPKSSRGSFGRSSSWICLWPSTNVMRLLFFFLSSPFSFLSSPFSLFASLAASFASFASLANLRASWLTSCCTMPWTRTVSARISRICCRVRVLPPGMSTVSGPLAPAGSNATRSGGAKAAGGPEALGVAASSLPFASAARKTPKESGMTPAPTTPNLWSLSERSFPWLGSAAAMPSEERASTACARRPGWAQPRY